MTAPRARGKRRRTAEPVDWMAAYLLHGHCVDLAAAGVNAFAWHARRITGPVDDPLSTIRDAWAARRAELLPSYIRRHPGRRPFAWWAVDAPRLEALDYPDHPRAHLLPAPRMRLGGIGTAWHEFAGEPPATRFGLPARWLTASEVECFTRIDPPPVDGFEDDDPGVIGAPEAPTEEAAHMHAIDPADPPRFESQATFLERHGLLLPRERLPAGAHAPEFIVA